MKKFLLSLLSLLALSAPQLDHHQLVFQWSVSFCTDARRIDEEKCRANVPMEFTVHGLWGADSRGIPITDECQKRSFIPEINNLPKPVYEDIKYYWPSHVAQRSNEVFWDHEWKLHGSCLFSSVDKYFTRARDLIRMVQTELGTLGLYQFFAENDPELVPTLKEGYAPSKFLDAIKERSRSRLVTKMKCNYNLMSTFMLYEITFCADKDAAILKNCTPYLTPDNLGKCNQAETVIYPLALPTSNTTGAGTSS